MGSKDASGKSDPYQVVGTTDADLLLILAVTSVMCSPLPVGLNL
jgi:hypothetical protein